MQGRCGHAHSTSWQLFLLPPVLPTFSLQQAGPLLTVGIWPLDIETRVALPALNAASSVTSARLTPFGVSLACSEKGELSISDEDSEAPGRGGSLPRAPSLWALLLLWSLIPRRS